MTQATEAILSRAPRLPLYRTFGDIDKSPKDSSSKNFGENGSDDYEPPQRTQTSAVKQSSRHAPSKPESSRSSAVRRPKKRQLDEVDELTDPEEQEGNKENEKVDAKVSKQRVRLSSLSHRHPPTLPRDQKAVRLQAEQASKVRTPALADSRTSFELSSKPPAKTRQRKIR